MSGKHQPTLVRTSLVQACVPRMQHSSSWNPTPKNVKFYRQLASLAALAACCLAGGPSNTGSHETNTFCRMNFKPCRTYTYPRGRRHPLLRHAAVPPHQPRHERPSTKKQVFAWRGFPPRTHHISTSIWPNLAMQLDGSRGNPGMRRSTPATRSPPGQPT